MARLHPASVNSLRIFTYYNGREASVVLAWLKAGRGGSIVDNGSAGGMLAAVDIDTGIVISDARDEDNRTYPVHPDTGAVFKGMQLEDWEEVTAMAKELAAIVPEVRLVGWDIALSRDHGWQLIEGNRLGMFNLLQVPTQKGMRKDFEKRIGWKKKPEL